VKGTRNGPTDAIDPTGLYEWIENKRNKTLTLSVVLKLVFVNSKFSEENWTEARKRAFRRKVIRVIQNEFNSNRFWIFRWRGAGAFNFTGFEPKSVWVKSSFGIYDFNQRGTFLWAEKWKPRLRVHVGNENFDHEVRVIANPHRYSMKSVSRINGIWIKGIPSRWNEDDVNAKAKVSYPRGTQITAAHKFGHLLGLEHPGPRRARDEYSRDAASLMGGGMELRAPYFKAWKDYLNSKYNWGYWQGLRSTDRPYSSPPVDFVKGLPL
jgi:hypothetical protein